ncbi:MAG: heavy metal translocating P-type ATPase [Candidatus Omnitrophica bacterium]|nr:heavy metal translocating P-type ATPase [Candidatus Omnitrophota bacterium]
MAINPAGNDSGNIEGDKEVIVNVLGMHCASCVVAIEGVLKKTEGINQARVNLGTEQAFVRYDPGKTDVSRIRKAIEKAGYRTLEGHKESDQEEEKRLRSSEILELRIRFWISFILSLPIAYISMAPGFELYLPGFVAEHSWLVQLMLATPIIFCGSEFFNQGILSLIRTKRANMNTLVSLGVGAAYLYSLFITVASWKVVGKLPVHGVYFETAGILVTFILLGKYLEASAKRKTSEAIKKLLALAPKTALVVRGFEEKEIPVEDIIIGDIVIVKPGERIAVDGIVIEGHSSVDESMITGESMPVDKSPGKEAVCGTINKTGAFKLEAINVGSDTMLSQIIKLVEEAQGKKAPVQELADRISAAFVPTVFIIAIIVFAAWLLAGVEFIFALNIFISVLIIACPCALGLATPTAVMVGTGIAAQNGILIRNPASLETAYKIDVVVFDKTGTLTRGKPVLTDYLSYHSRNREEILALAASIERKSEHPVAEAIVSGARERNIQLNEVQDFVALPGKGVMARFNNEQIFFGNRKLMEKKKIEIADQVKADSELMENQGKTVMFLVSGSKIIGLVAVGDTLKDFAMEAIAALKKLKKQVLMVTGDNHRTAESIARYLGLDDVFSEVLPQDKEEQIKKLQSLGLKVAMVGDGINDAPALAQADIGIALGSGTDIAIESGDIVLIKDDLRDVVMALDLSRFAMKKIRQNLFWAFFYNLIGIPIAAGILYPLTGFLLNPMVAGAAMAFSSVSVVSNSLSMKRYRRSI